MTIFNRFAPLTVASTIALSLASGSAFAALTKADCQGIVANAVTAAGLADSDFRPGVVPPKMQIVCLDRTGKILASDVDPDAWVGSIISREQRRTRRWPLAATKTPSAHAR